MLHILGVRYSTWTRASPSPQGSVWRAWRRVEPRMATGNFDICLRWTPDYDGGYSN